MSVTAPAGALSATITGARADGSRKLDDHPYRVGEQVPYTFRVQNTSSTTITVTPTSGDFSPFLPPGTGTTAVDESRRERRLHLLHPAAHGDAGRPRRGYFVADTVWSLSASGATTRSISVNGGQVAVR